MSQLQMRFFADRCVLPGLAVPEGFRLRTLSAADCAAYNALRESAGFGAFSEKDFQAYLENNALPGGSFLIEEAGTGRFAASAGAERYLADPSFGVLGWVMCHPDFRGRHLGRAVCLAAMYRLSDAGYRTFTLLTDDFRLPAIRTYLKLGWHPYFSDETMPDRWRAIAARFQLDPDKL